MEVAPAKMATPSILCVETATPVFPRTGQLATGLLADQASALKSYQLSLESETAQNTLRNFVAMQKRAREEESCCRPLRAVKRSCSFSRFAQVRILAEEQEETTVSEQEQCCGKDLSPSHCCPDFLFASWGDNAECAMAPSGALINSKLAVRNKNLDFELETKKGDGPEAVSLVVKNLIEEALKLRVSWRQQLNPCYSSNSHIVDTQKFALEPAILEAVYARIQKISVRVQEAHTGSVGLLPDAVSINMSHLPVLNYLLLKLHQAAVAQLHSRLPTMRCDATSSNWVLPPSMQ